MALVIKVMSGDNAHDDAPGCAHRLFTGVSYVEFDRDKDGLPQAYFFYESSHREAEWVAPGGNVYVMNEAGRTISRFEYEPPLGWEYVEGEAGDEG